MLNKLFATPGFIPTDDVERDRRVKARWSLMALIIVTACMAALAPNPLSAGIVSLGFLGVGGMLIDAECLLSDAQALTATAVSTNTYDTGAAGNSIEIGEPLAMVITVGVAADATTGDETYQFQVIQSANANLSSHDVLSQTDTSFVTRATLVAGAKVVMPIPPGKTKRYLGLRYVLGGTTPTLTVTSFIQPLRAVQLDKTYADAITISS